MSSQEAARRHLLDPVGRPITLNGSIPAELKQRVGGPGSREVVGVVTDVTHLALADEPVPMFYTLQA